MDDDPASERARGGDNADAIIGESGNAPFAARNTTISAELSHSAVVGSFLPESGAAPSGSRSTAVEVSRTSGRSGTVGPAKSRSTSAASYAMPALEWTQPETKFPELCGPRAAHSTTFMMIGSRPSLVTFGGWDGRAGLTGLAVLDVETMTWSAPQTCGASLSARNNHATFVYGARLYIHGGHDGQRWLADLACLNTNVSPWEWTLPVVSGTAPTARACHTVTVLGSSAYMFGGYDGVRCFSDLEVLDLDTLKWTQPMINGSSPQARNAQTVTAVGSKLFLFGGHSGNKHLRDLHVLDTKSNPMAWSAPEIQGAPPPGLRGHTANLIEKQIYLFGGYDGRGRSNDLFLLDTESMRWEHPQANETTPAGRQRHTACVVHSKKLFVLGGFDGAKWLNDLHVLDVGRQEESAIMLESVSTLLSDLASMVNNVDAFPDITFIVEDEPIYAHRGILVSRSRHFKAMLSSGYKESRTEVITYPPDSAVTRRAFLSLLEYVYCGTVAGLHGNIPHAIEVVALAQYAGIDSLKDLAESSLIHAANVGNVCALLLAAHKHHCTKLHRNCMELLLKNSSVVSFDALQAEPALLLELTRRLVDLNRK